MGDNPQEKPKIIVDEDWKGQAQAEKERLAREQEGRAQHEPAGQAAATPQGTPSPGEAASRGPLPPATLSTLVSQLMHQAMFGLGAMAHPISGKAEVRLEEAKFAIDLLGVIEEKTAGNRTSDESQLIDEVLHELRMMYVHVQSSAAGGANSAS
jgi:hypothetical protein